MTKAAYKEQAAQAAETFGNMCETIQALIDAWEGVKAPAVLAADVAGVRDTLDAARVMMGAFKSELSRKAK